MSVEQFQFMFNGAPCVVTVTLPDDFGKDDIDPCPGWMDAVAAKKEIDDLRQKLTYAENKLRQERSGENNQRQIAHIAKAEASAAKSKVQIKHILSVLKSVNIENKHLKEALHFYGAKTSWLPCEDDERINPATLDSGKLARGVIRKKDEMMEVTGE